VVGLAGKDGSWLGRGRDSDRDDLLPNVGVDDGLARVAMSRRVVGVAGGDSDGVSDGNRSSWWANWLSRGGWHWCRRPGCPWVNS
jgi:hypothetical protein